MLSLFRQGGVAQVLLGGVVLTIILVFVLEFRRGGGTDMGTLKEECAVEVQGYCVTPKEFNAALGLVSVPGLEPKEMKRLKLQERVMDGLIERELLLKVAEKYDLSTSDDALDEELIHGHAHVSLPAADAAQIGYYLLLCRHDPAGRGCEPGGPTEVRKLRVEGPDGVFDPKLYERELRYRANRGPKEFKEMQRREVTAARMRDLVRTRVQVSDEEAFSLFEKERSRATVRYAQLNRDWFAKFAVAASKEMVATWASTHASEVDAAVKLEKGRFKENCPLVSEIRVDFLPGASDSDKTLTRERIDAALDRLNKPGTKETFADVAREVSDAPSSMLGGRVGCLDASYGAGAEELLKAVGTLKPGKRSGVVETENGYHIVQLDGLLAKGDIDKVARELVETRLAVQASAQTLLESFAKAAVEQTQAGRPLSDVITALAREYARVPKKSETAPALEAASRPKVEISAPFAIRDQPITTALPSEAVAQKVFALKKVDEFLPSPVKTSEGLCLVQLKEKDLATRAQFDKDKALLMRGLKQVRAQEALTSYVADLRKKAEKEIKVNPAFLPKANAKDAEPAG